MSSPLTAPSTNTALKAPRTAANGCVLGTMAGWTRTEISGPPSTSSAMASSLTEYPSRLAYATSAALTPLMPSRCTSASTMSLPNASEARMAALAAASCPSTSAVGSRSARPSSLASRSTSS